jgi:hypothetical protein
MNDVEKILDPIIEQTNILMQIQSSAKEKCFKMFSETLNTIEVQIKKNEGTDDGKSLERIHDSLSGRAQSFSDQIQEDIDFLSEQLGSLQEIKKIKDIDKAKKILETIVEADEEVIATEEFKKNIEADSQELIKTVSMILEDINSAINEKNFDDVEALLESIEDEDGDEEEIGEEGEETEVCDKECSCCDESCNIICDDDKTKKD